MTWLGVGHRVVWFRGFRGHGVWIVGVGGGGCRGWWGYGMVGGGSGGGRGRGGCG